ncbi:MAG: peptidase M28, partial [Gemmatimonadetes bacterium]|nr:peptidase M28 [Gemmatimonadota bacterium]
MRTPLPVCLGLVTTLAACGTGGADSGGLDSPQVQEALDGVTPDAVETHIRVLADDSLAGRAPGTQGYADASAYVEGVFEDLDLEPMGDDGTYRQAVPLRHSTVDVGGSALSITGPAGVRQFAYMDDYYLGADLLGEDRQVVDAPLAFVGYGVSAPDLGYDDYAGVDVDGKVVVWLSGAPASFPSNERAYYSSGATKEAEAVARGAVG